MPCGVLLADESNQPAATTSNSANWYDVEQAANLFNSMNTRARQVRKEFGPLQVQGYEINWRDHAERLGRVKNHVNAIGKDLKSLDQMKGRLEPWQQRLVAGITPNAREMANQTEQALNKLAGHQDRDRRRLMQYPNNIDQIYQNANQMANIIENLTQAAHGEQMSALHVLTTNSGS